MKNGKTSQQYPERIRCFALTLHYYSPKAYNYIRSLFKNTLPAVSTLRTWYSGIDGRPGISTEALVALKKKAGEAIINGKQPLVCVSFDEMAVRKQLLWDQNEQKIVGYADYGSNHADNNDDETLPIAKEALVYLVNGIGDSYWIPVAYFLIDGLKTDEKAALTSEIILALSKTGLKVVAMTFDGLPVNTSMCVSLGADFENDKPYIVNPHSNDNIYIFMDPSHVEKNARNCLANKKVLYDENNQKIEWNYVVELEKLQRTNGLNLGNKLKKAHIQWKRKQMKVGIACETLSDSVADSLDLLAMCNVGKFENSLATSKYFRYSNNLFDIMNSHHDDASNFKRPVSVETSAEYFAYFDEATSYIKQLKLRKNGKSILLTKSKTAFFGFIINMQNIKNIYEEYVAPGILENFKTADISQDKLERMFGRVRKMGGNNDNPTAQQLTGAMRRLYIHNDVTASSFSNCKDDGSKMLSISTIRRKKDEGSSEIVISDSKVTEENLVMTETEPINDQIGNIQDLEVHSLAYVSSEIEKTIIESKSKKAISCSNCLKVFSENEKMDNSFVTQKMKTKKITQPCLSTFSIVKMVDDILNSHENFQNKYKDILNEIVGKIELDSVYQSSNFETHGDNHKFQLVKKVAETYMTRVWRIHVARKTEDCHKKFLRQKWRKIIQFVGQ